MRGFMQTAQKSDVLDFGDIVAKVSYAFPYKGYGLIIRLSKEDNCGKRGLCKVLGKKRQFHSLWISPRGRIRKWRMENIEVHRRRRGGTCKLKASAGIFDFRCERVRHIRNEGAYF